MHDWDDEESIKILKHLRDAASPTSKLLLLEHVIVETCGSPDDNGVLHGVGLPAPILPNGGAAALMGCTMDLQMVRNLALRADTRR